MKQLTEETVKELVGKRVVAVLNNYTSCNNPVGIIGEVGYSSVTRAYYIHDIRKSEECHDFNPDMDRPGMDTIVRSQKLFPNTDIEEATLVILSEDGNPQDIYGFER